MQSRTIVLILFLTLAGAAHAQQILDNGDPADRLFKIDYVTYQGDHEVWLTNGVVFGTSRIESTVTGSFQSITFTNPTSSLTIQLGDGTNTFHLYRLDDDFQVSIQVNGEGGHDTFNVNEVSKFVTTGMFYGDNGNDVFNIAAASNNLDLIETSIVLHGGSNNVTPQTSVTIKGVVKSLPVGDTLNVRDNQGGEGAVYTVGGTTIARTGIPNISYTTMETVLLDTSEKTNNITLNNNVANRNITIDAGGQADIIVQNNTANFGNTILQGKNGQDDITVDGSGIGEFLVIEGNQSSDTISVNKVPVNGRTQVLGGLQGDTINVRESAAFTVVDIECGSGSDVVNIGSFSNTLNTVLGTVWVNGETNDAGSTSLNIGGVGNTLDIGDKLNILNQGEPGFTWMHITETNMQRSGSGSVFNGNILFEQVETFSLELGDGVNTVNISNTADMVNFTVLGGNATNFVTVFDLGLLANVRFYGGSGLDDVEVRDIGGAFFLVDTEDGADLVCLAAGASGSRAQIDGGSGSDDIFVGTRDPSLPGNLDTVDGAVFVNGEANNTVILNSVIVKGEVHALPAGDNLIIDNANGGSVGTLTVTETNVGWSGSGGVAYQSIETLDIEGRLASPNVMTITRTPDNSTVRIVGSPFPDGVDVEALGTNGNFVCNTGADDDVVNIYGGGDGTFSQHLTSSGEDTISLVSNATNERILIDAGFGEDVVNVREVKAGGVLEVLGGSDSDTINISSLAPVVTGSIDGVVGMVCVDGGAHGTNLTTLTIKGADNTLPEGDILNIGDEGTIESHVFTVDTGMVDRAGITIEYANIETLNVGAGEGGNTFDILDTAESANTTITSTKGPDEVNVMDLGDNANVTINSGRNADVIDVYTTGTGTFFWLAADIFNDTVTYRSNGIASRTSIRGGQGFDVIDVLATATDSVVEVIGATEADEVRIGYNGPVYDSIKGNIYASGNNPTSAPGDNLYISGNRAASITDDGSTINVAGFAPIEYDTFELAAAINESFNVVTVGTNLNVNIPGTNIWNIIPEYTDELNEDPQAWLPLGIITTQFNDGTNVIATFGAGTGEVYHIRVRFEEP